MKKISMTDNQIARVIAVNDISKKEEAIDCLFERYLKDISSNNKDINVLNETFYSKIMHSPKSYARWVLNLTSEMVSANTSVFGFVDFSINHSDNSNYTEFKFDIYNYKNKNKVDCDKEISVLISKNGIVVDFDGEYASIARNRSNPSVWNANVSEGLLEYLPLEKIKKENNKNKAKSLRI